MTMFLPKPNALTLPEAANPTGIGLEACNSGNSCRGISCDAKTPPAETCGWKLVVWTLATPATAAF